MCCCRFAIPLGICSTLGWTRQHLWHLAQTQQSCVAVVLQVEVRALAVPINGLAWCMVQVGCATCCLQAAVCHFGSRHVCLL